MFQHSKDGWVYLYDLGSTHGTKMNKMKAPPRQFVRVKVGSVIKFGESTRLHILLGPPQYEEDHEVHTVMSGEKAEEQEETTREVTWGMSDDTEGPEYGAQENGRDLDTSDDGDLPPFFD